MASMRFGVLILPEQRWSIGRDVWRRAEALGFDHAWTYDHLAWRSLRDSAWFGAIPTLTAAAAATEHIRLGPLVATPSFRHPVLFAKELMTLDDISGGRLTLGVGAGGRGWDATMLGEQALSPGARADRFAEFVNLTDRLLRQPAVSYEGRFYSAVEARNHPGCLQRPRIPFAVAATGPRGMRLAATFGQTWVTTGEGALKEPAGAERSAAAVREQMVRVDEACAELGRAPDSLGRLVVTGPLLDPGLSSVESFRDTASRYGEVGVTDVVVHWPRSEEPYAADMATFERIFSSL